MGAKRGVAPVQHHFSKWVAVLGGCLLVLVFASLSQGVSTSERSPPLDGGGHGSKGGASRCASKLWGGRNGSVALARSLDDDAARAWRACSEALYRERRATLVFVHVHKGGGTTFVGMARGNAAGLAAEERNGDPVGEGRERVAWWTLDAQAQARWFARLRGRDGVRFVSTEKGFPRYSTNLLAPAGLVYAIVVREPARRFVSYYFWKWRDVSAFELLRVKARRAVPSLFGGAGRDIARLRAGAPTFEAFVDAETRANGGTLDGYYVRRLLGVAPEDATAFSLDAGALADATTVLARAFSLVLLTERLADLGPLVAAALDWRRTDFADFHAKSNPAPDLAKLAAWRDDWSDEIARRMPLDVQFYDFAARLCQARLDAV